MIEQALDSGDDAREDMTRRDAWGVGNWCDREDLPVDVHMHHAKPLGCIRRGVSYGDVQFEVE